MGIGFGQQAIVPAFRLNGHCEVVALCASTAQRARVVADRLGVPKAYGNWQELVSDPDIDVIAVATPPPVQPAIVCAALSQRKPVFCEKPLAPTREIAAGMLAIARQSGLAHMVDFEFAAIEEWIQAKVIVERGALGRLRHASVSWHVETYANRMGLKSWKTGDAALGGGILNSAVSHTFHYLEWMLGRIHRLSARLFVPAERDWSGGETVAVLCLELTGGVLVSVSVSSSAFLGTGHRLEIYGDEGSLVLENHTADYVAGFRLLHGTRQTNRLDPLNMEKGERTVQDGRVLAVGRLVDRFVDWVRTGVPAIPSFEEGYRVQCLVDWARQAHATGGWVDVSSSDQKPNTTAQLG